MSQIDDTQKAGAARAFLVVAGVAMLGGAVALQGLGLFTPTEAAQGHVVVGWGDAGMPSDAVLVKATARATDAAVSIFGVGPTDAGFSYWRVYVCASPVDGGVDPGPHLAPGMDVVFDDSDVAPCPAGTPQLEAWRQGRADAPFTCACAMDVSCVQPDGGSAPQGITLAPGQWSGSGCLPKACVILAGSEDWPAQCPGGAP